MNCNSFFSSHKRPPSIVLPCGGLRELVLVSDQLYHFFRISEVVANESFDCTSLACSKLRDGGGSRSVIRNAENARGLGRAFPQSCASYFRFARFNTFPLYYLRAWHRLALALKTTPSTKKKMPVNLIALLPQTATTLP